MAPPLILLVAVTLAARVAGALGLAALDTWPAAITAGLAAMLLLTGGAHFVQPLRGELVAMVPPRLPRPETLVTVTGVLEVAGAVGLLVPATRVAAAICLALLLVVMFPANVHAARAERGMRSMPLPARAALQVVFVGACAVAAFA
ncbi:DoxX family protein [Isoptericola sp. NEAU-Y5]|uniref:DoxX family protein n=1 Tax=Isoptericola luteus TaxID=2879484 RepID=A0ABS7ZEN8_9MICO|nr:DoxX family protein [Isoptericola sp. NEAU-Y5]MCA5892942.1 DoxX family protein [Isoptericola sp. NEAU-Y5]